LGAIVCGLVWGFTRWLLSWRREHPVAAPVKPSGPDRARVLRLRDPITVRELLVRVAPARLTDIDPARLHAALHDGDASDAPVLVRVFTTIGTWIGAAMVAVIFAAMEVYEIVPLAVFLAIALFGYAIVLSRRPHRSLALTQ